MVHFPAVRQEKSLSVGTALGRGGTDLRLGTGTRGGQQLALFSARQKSGKRISETKPDRKRAKCPVTHLCYADMRWTETAVLSCHRLAMVKTDNN